MKKISFLGKILVTFSMMFVMAGAFSTKTEAKVEKIKVTAPSGKTVRVAKGKKVKLKTTVKKLKNKKVKFKSNNPKIARVTAKGFVKGIKKGKTKIVVSSKSNPKIKKTIKVVVYKKAVNKIKLNKKKVNLTNGHQFKLTANISPKKNVSKVLSYKSSNKKVATVTKKGIIKAVAAGTAKITVKATDGSKKKATCVVTVKGANEEDKTPVEIKSVKLRSAFSLDVELNKAKALTYEDFTILCKQPDDKEFKDIFDIISLNTFDNIHYEVVIRENKMFDYKSTLKVVIKNLDGENEKEIYVNRKFGDYGYGPVAKTYSEDYVSSFYYFGANVGEEFSYNEDFYSYIKADLKSIAVTELPKGLKTKIASDKSFVEISGVFAEKTNGYKTVITAVDMNDKVFTIDLYFYVGDENTVYAKGYDAVKLAYNPHKDDVDSSLRGSIFIIPEACVSETDVSNLSDCSNFKANGVPENMYLDEKGYLNVSDESKPVKSGVYNISISATTPLGKDFTVIYKLTLVDGVTVKGRLTDLSGKGIDNETINFKKKFYTGRWTGDYTATTDENGYYDIRIIPGKYDINSWFDSIYNSYIVDFSKDQTYNMKSLCYKVVFKSPLLDRVLDADTYENGIILNTYNNHIYDTKGNSEIIYGEWNKQEDNKYHFNLYTYLKKGTYGFGEYNNETGFDLGRFYFNDLEEEEKYDILTKQITVNKTSEIELKLEKVE